MKIKALLLEIPGLGNNEEVIEILAFIPLNNTTCAVYMDPVTKKLHTTEIKNIKILE